MPAMLPSVTRAMLETIAPDFTGFNRVMLSNLWLFWPLVEWQMAKKPSADAMLRTTTALTVLRAGNKEQVLPEQAQALVNFRLLPGETRESVMAHVKAVIDDNTIKVKPKGPFWEASPVSRTDTLAYKAISRTIRDVFPGIVVAPGLMVGATDSHHYAAIANNIYRFSPVRAQPEDLARFHGSNERLSVSNYAEMVRFYHRLLSNVAGEGAR